MSASPRREFLDTNVIVYSYDSSALAKHERARALMAELWRRGEGAVSVQVLEEFFVAVTRKVRRPLAPEAAARIVEDLGRMRTHAPALRDVLEAIEIHRETGRSFWDAMILRSALQMGCEVLWSEDLQTGRQYRGITVENPFLRAG